MNLLDELKAFAKVKPAVNQIQINLKEPNKELLAVLKEECITPVAWGPMKSEANQKEVLDEIGKAYIRCASLIKIPN